MLPYIPFNGPPPKVDGAPEQISDYPSPSSSLPPPPPPQLHAPPSLTEEQFMDDFMLFSNATGVRLSEQAFLIEGRVVNPWELHRIVSARNGFDSVTMNGEWPTVGVDLGFSQVTWGYPGQWGYCSPAVAHQLQQLYQDTLRHFDQANSCGMIAQLKNSQAPAQVQVPPQSLQSPAQPLAHQRTEADYQALLANTTTSPESSVMIFEAINILPRFWDASGAELEAHRVPQHVIAFVEQNREHLKWLAQFPRVQGGFAPTESPQLGRQTLPHKVSSLQIAIDPSLLSHESRHYQEQQQRRRADGESTHGDAMSFSLPQQQLMLAMQRNLMQRRALERVAMTPASLAPSFQVQTIPQQLSLASISGGMPTGTTQQQTATLLQRAQLSTNSQIDPSQPITQTQDLSQGQQQQNDSGLGSRMVQNFDSPGMGLPQGPGSLQQNFIQPSPSLHHADPQPSSAPLASQPQPGAQQGSGPANLATMSLPQLRSQSTLLLQFVMESEKNLPAAGSSGESDVHRQLRVKVENNKRYIRMMQDLINARTRASGDATQALNGGVKQTNGAPPQSLQIPSQQPIQPNKLPPLSEERFKINFIQFSRSKGIRFNERDLVIEGRQINLWVLHRTVFLRNGYDSVTAHDEWPVIGAALGFPPVPGGDASRPPRCGPAMAHRLQQLYNEVLRQFDQVYISSIIARSRNSQASGQFSQPAPPQAQPRQPTEADYQALLASITSEPLLTNVQMMCIIPRFSHTSGAELEAHHVPPHVIAFLEQHRVHFQRSDFKPIRSEPLNNHTQVNHASPIIHQMSFGGLQYSNLQLQQSQRQGPVQGLGKPSALPPAQLFYSGPPPTSPVSTKPAAMNGVPSGLIVRRPTQEDFINAKRRVDEMKREAFSCAPDIDAVASFYPIQECDIQEYHRNVERLDQVLSNIEKYIHFAFALLKKEDIVKRMFKMMAAVKLQIEELKKPNPRYVLELHTIRGMIQEVDNMDKGLKAVLQKSQTHMPPGGFPSAPQSPPQPPSAVTTTQFFPPANPDLPQGVEPAPSPEAMSHRLEDVRISLGKLEI